MKTKRARTRAILKQVEQRADRSPLFHWMVEHHDEMLAKAKGGKLMWVELCVAFHAHGLTNRLGLPASERTAREAWYQARKAVAQQRADAARQAAKAPAARTLMPSASPRERVPIEYPRPQPYPPKPAEPNGPASPTDRTPAEARADAHIARMKRHFAERDGRKPPSS